MIAKAPRRLKHGREFDGLISRAKPQYRQVLADANTDDTLKLIETVVRGSLSQTRTLAKRLQGSSLNATCKNIWDFIYQHIQYAKDTPGAEEIRDPGRTWADRKSPGVDCDDYAVFTSSILVNLGIPHFLRVTAYGGDWQHIYVVVPKNAATDKPLDQSRRSAYIVIDDVTDHFDYEVRYTKKQDIAMTLNHLSGLPTNRPQGEIDGLGKTWFGKAFQAVGKAATFVAKPVAKAVVAVAKTVRTVATTPIRLGILAWMKTDFRKGAQRLRWGYVPYSECAKYTDYGPKAHAEIVDALKRITNTFVNNLGGQANVLKMAIVTGKGNTNREVPSTVANIPGFSGLGAMPDDKTDPDYAFVMGLSGFNMNQRVNHPELHPGMSGLGVVEPVSTTIIAAASAIMIPLLNLLKGKEADPSDPVPDEYRPAPAPPEPDPVDDQAQLDTLSDDAPADDTSDTTPEPAADDTSLGAIAARKKKAAVRVKAAVVKHVAAGKPVTAVHKTVAKKAAVVAKKPAVHKLAPVAAHTTLRPLPVSLTLPVVKPLVPKAAVPKTKSKAGKLIKAVGNGIKSAEHAVASGVKKVLHPAVLPKVAPHPAVKAAVKKTVQHKAKVAKAAEAAGDQATADQLRQENAEMVQQTVRQPIPAQQSQSTVDAGDYNPDMTQAAPDPVTNRLNRVANTVDRAQQYANQGTAIINQARQVISRQPTPAPSPGTMPDPAGDDYTPYEDVTTMSTAGDGTDSSALVAQTGQSMPMTGNMGTIAAVGLGAVLLGMLFAGRHAPHAAAKRALSGTPKKKATKAYKGNRSKKAASAAKSTKRDGASGSHAPAGRPFSGIDL